MGCNGDRGEWNASGHEQNGAGTRRRAALCDRAFLRAWELITAAAESDRWARLARIAGWRWNRRDTAGIGGSCRPGQSRGPNKNWAKDSIPALIDRISSAIMLMFAQNRREFSRCLRKVASKHGANHPEVVRARELFDQSGGGTGRAPDERGADSLSLHSADGRIAALEGAHAAVMFRNGTKSDRDDDVRSMTVPASY